MPPRIAPEDGSILSHRYEAAQPVPARDFTAAVRARTLATVLRTFAPCARNHTGTYGNNPDESRIGVPSDFSVTVKDNGAFFNVRNSRGRTFEVGLQKYAPNTLRARLEILVHETAHLVPAAGFQKDFGNPLAAEANNKLVDVNCKAFIEGI